MKTKRRLLTAGIVIGSLFTLAPLLCFFATTFGMMRAFEVLGKSGVADPNALSANIGGVLVFTAIGWLLFPVGVIVLVLSLIFYPRRSDSPPALPVERQALR